MLTPLASSMYTFIYQCFHFNVSKTGMTMLSNVGTVTVVSLGEIISEPVISKFHID